MKNSKGITIISLVVTIIILLILAGVSINLLSGGDGLMSKTQNAVIENNVAEAKERVALRIAEYQTDYYKAVYVDKNTSVNVEMGDWVAQTHQGEVIDAGDYKFEITKTTAPYQVTILKNNRIKGNIVGEMSADGKIAWNDEIVVGSGSSNTGNSGNVSGDTSGEDNNSNSGESGGNSSGTGSNVSSEELETLRTTIATLEAKVEDLETQSATKTELESYATKSEIENLGDTYATKNQMEQANTKIDSAQDQIDNMLTGTNVNSRTTLFSGTAGTIGGTYTISDISSYKYIIVYADVIGNSIRTFRTSRIINVQDIVYNNSTNYVANCAYGNSEQANDAAKYCIAYWFKNSTSLYISDASSSFYTSPRIYKIEGIK